MDVFFITSVIGLKIKSDLNRGEKLDKDTYITNNLKKIKKEFTPEFAQVIGSMEFHDLTNADMVIYSKETITNSLTPEQFLISKLYKVEKFHSALWMLKDNCVNNELGFLSYNLKGGISTVSSNFIAIVNSTSQGKIKSDIILTKSELKKVIQFGKNINIGDVCSLPTTQLIKGHDRISRAYYLIQAARAQSDVAIKISHYCTAFESLFATSPSELTHKLSERVAFFLEDNADCRIETFQFIKKAYGVRSKIVHGNVVKDSFLDELKKVSKKCDDLMRRVIVCTLQNKTIQDIFSSSPAQIDNFFADLIFGKKKIDEYYPNEEFKKSQI